LILIQELLHSNVFLPHVSRFECTLGDAKVYYEACLEIYLNPHYDDDIKYIHQLRNTFLCTRIDVTPKFKRTIMYINGGRICGVCKNYIVMCHPLGETNFGIT
jgi:hypothetical protein